MRPIETEYRSITFRSRTEARWAVFFDAIEEPWAYESETFETPVGGYTPDFWLSSSQCFAEVKPEWPTRLELLKVKALTKVKPVKLLIGLPDFKFYWMLGDSGDGRCIEFATTFCGLSEETQFECLINFRRELTPDDFPRSYHRAVDKSRHYLFDGFEEDRQTIRERYA